MQNTDHRLKGIFKNSHTVSASHAVRRISGLASATEETAPRALHQPLDSPTALRARLPFPIVDTETFLDTRTRTRFPVIEESARPGGEVRFCPQSEFNGRLQDLADGSP